MPSSTPNYGDLYSDPATNPSGYVPTSSVPGREHTYAAVADALRQAGYNPSGVDPNSPTGYNYLQGGLGTYTNLADWGGDYGSGGMYPMSGGFSGGGGGGGYGYGGGGGGGGPAGMSQDQFDWAVSLLGQGQPEDLVATALNLPNYRGKFRGRRYDVLRNQFDRAVNIDQRAANRAYRNYNQYLNQNYTNAFNNPNASYATMASAPGTNQQQMARMVQLQGIDPSVAGAQLEGAAAADQGFANLWSVLAANEDLAQRNRLTAAQQDQMTTNNALNVAALQGRTGIGLQRASAFDEWMQRRQDWINNARMQEALMSWQRANEVADTNYQGDASYRNNVISALLGMLPGLAEGVTMPDLWELGIGERPAEPEAPDLTPRQRGRRHRYRREHGGGEGE